ncbi:MAG: PrsW family intramembrane metalloprotease [Flavobacteriales bacterium]|nr:PrsW family intramembrane metalloprotease [Flavobacteriales bacterium]
MIFLTLAISLLFIYFWVIDFRRAYRIAGNWQSFSASTKFYETLYFIILVGLPLLFVNHTNYGRALSFGGDELLYTTSIILSLGISFMWYQYLTWLDIYERERFKFLLLVFLISCSLSFLVFPLTDVVNGLGLSMNGEFWNDWWYSVIGIGLIEEIVKIMPFLFILKLTKQVNEPFDYILYGSVSALGFAFIENVLYLYQSNLLAIYGRALFASVAHMFFTSVICYGMAIAKHRNYAWKIYALPVFLLLAALGHGFYDFWLINLIAKQWYLISTLFFLFCIHLWVTMKNNLINISSFFDRTILLNSPSFKYKIILGLVAIFDVAYLAYFLMYGKSEANHLLLESWVLNIYMVLYLAVSFENFKLIQGYVAPIYVPRGILDFFIPKMEEEENYTGTTIKLVAPEGIGYEMESLRQSLPVSGVLVRRIVFKGDTSWYVFIPDAPIYTADVVDNMFLIKPKKKGGKLLRADYVSINLLGLSRTQDFEDGTVKAKNAEFLHFVQAKIVDPVE